METDKLDQLWSILDRKRHLRHDLLSLLDVAKQHGIRLTVADIRHLGKRMGRYGGEYYLPESIVKFIADYLSDRMVRSILDPWAGLGALLLPIAEATGAEVAVGIEPNSTNVEALRTLDDKSAVNWLCGEPIRILDDVTGNFDVIASNPPWGVRPTKVSLPSEVGVINIQDDLGHLIVLKACLRLSQDGVGLFVLPPSFVLKSQKRSVFTNLSDFGLSLFAYIAIPSGFFAPHTKMPAALLFVRKGKPANIFVGELSENPDRNQLVLENLRAGKEGKEIALGKIIEKGDFKGYESLVAEDRITRLASRMGLEPLPLSEVVSEIKLTKSAEPSGFEERTNAVYLPLIGRSNAVASQSELTLKAHNYAQLTIKPDKAYARYVAAFFNTPLGHNIRESAHSGVTIPKITKSSLAHIQLFLPDRETQIQVLEADTKASSLVSELKELRDQLWSRPRQLTRITKELEKVNREERFADWLDDLPFPLASILWAYHAADPDHRKQYEHLDHFFEALAEFLAILLLSGFLNDPELFASERSKISRTLSQKRLSIERSSFGTWVKIAERMAKKARTMLNSGKAKRLSCEELFRTSDFDVLQSLFSSKLIGILQETNSLRNDWRGHGGVVGDQIAYERHITLQSYLTQVRECFGDIWNRYQLVLPRSMKFTEGSFSIVAHRLMGVRIPFESIDLHTSEPMEDKRLHLIGQAEQRALNLLPLVKIMPSPTTAQNACYFYNRMEEGGLRFISYHFEAEAEIVDTFGETAEAISIILHNTDASGKR